MNHAHRQLVLGVIWVAAFGVVARAQDASNSAMPITEPTRCVGHYHTEEEGAQQLERFRDTFSNQREWRQRVEKTRKQFLEQSGMAPLPARTPLNPILRNRREHAGYATEALAFEAMPGFFVYGTLYWPTGADSTTHPAVLSVHGHWNKPNGGARFRPDNQIRCATLARMGAIVLAVDMIGYGESARHGWKHHSDHTMRLHLWSNMRAVDYLCDLEAVDQRRIAVTGASGGGTQSIQLGLLDSRVDVMVPVCMVSAHFFGGCVCESGYPVHLTPEHATNNVDIAASFAPKPQLLISVGGDWSKNTPTVEYPYIQQVYGLFDAKDRVENAHFADEGHDYGPSKRKALYPFLAKHLALDLSKVNEEKVVIETAEEMVLFDDAHPLPSHALEPNEWPSFRKSR